MSSSDANLPRVLALVPARGGSKSFPGKNVMPLKGKPMIAYSIQAAIESARIDRVVVTTDCPEIATISREHGAETPFLRPAELARDDSLDIEYLRHALEWLAENENYHPALVAILRPTEPIRRSSTIDQAIDTLVDHPEADSLRSVRVATETPFKMWYKDASGFLSPTTLLSGTSEPYNQPRQSLPPVYWQDGYLDIARAETILRKNSATGDTILSFLIEEETVNIDYADEFEEAERALENPSASAAKKKFRHPS